MLEEHKDFIKVLFIGTIVWIIIFIYTSINELSVVNWNDMLVELGPHPTPDYIFGIGYQFEGYGDYAIYYMHWGRALLNGVPMYADLLRIPSMDSGYVYGEYIFPPFMGWLCQLGVFIHPRIGIAALITLFGFLTVFPVYGITKEISKDNRVGAIAAGTYLLNPIILYYIAYLWLNPSTYSFFVMLGCYMFIKNKNIVGVFCFITAAMFKQIVWFMVIPIMIYLIVKNRKKFIKIAVASATYIGVVMLPFIFELPRVAGRLLSGLQPVVDYHWGYEYPRNYGWPMTLTEIFISMEQYTLAEIYFVIQTSGVIMWVGVLVCSTLIIKKCLNKGTWRDVLYLTFIMLFWVHLFSPRGSFKYYFAFIMPFVSIFSSKQMISGDSAKVSIGNITSPLIVSFLIWIPVINVYLLWVLFIIVGYIGNERIVDVYNTLKRRTMVLKSLIIEKWKTKTDSERKLYKIIAGLVIFMVIACNNGYIIGYNTGYDHGNIDGQLADRRMVYISIEGLDGFECAKNITISNYNGFELFSSFSNATGNFTIYLGDYYIGVVVMFDMTLFVNITEGYNNNITISLDYQVGNIINIQYPMNLNDIGLTIVVRTHEIEVLR